jgi:hypothetical protein
MTLRAPNLDDRNFQQLVDEAKRIIRTNCPEWTDLSVGDPGTVLLEVFAFLTETMIYRLNRLPEKAYVEFLRLIGVKLAPPVAASVNLSFTLNNAKSTAVEIPRGTRVTLARAGGNEPPPTFVVLKSATIPAGKLRVEAAAWHCELIEGEDAGKATGEPGFSVNARRPPIVAATSDDLELLVAVEATEEDLKDRPRSLKYNGQAYMIWQEVNDFSDLSGRRQVYVVDRHTGSITFAPALYLRDESGNLQPGSQALADVPKAGRQIRLWYCTGGGLAGNVAATSLTTLKDPIAGVAVINSAPAVGGRESESLENALVRGPQELHSLQRAVTARDFELLALRSSGTVASSGAVARAKAFTRAAVWEHAAPGTIEVILVPYVPIDQRPNGHVTEESLKAHETDEGLANVQHALDERRPLGTTCLVNWVRYKEVRVKARAVVHRGENADAVEARVLKRLNQSINPLPSDLPTAGWPFRQPLRASHVYDIMLAEPGVNFVDSVRLLVDEVPKSDITALAADTFQHNTWYATTGAKLFRSMDDGEGWELINRFPDDEETARIRVNNWQPGQVAVITNPTSGAGSRLYISDDCGEHWRRQASTAFQINDVAWTSRGDDPVLMLATNNGLFELLLAPGSAPVQIIVDPARPNSLGFISVAAAVGVRGTPYIAVAARTTSGVSVYLSTKGGPSPTFDPLSLKDENVKTLEIQQDGPRTFLWAALALVTGSSSGKGAVRWELQGGSAGAHTSLIKGWDGGSCHALAFTNSFAYAATHDKGVLWLDLAKGEAASWRAPLKESGLKIREDENRTFEAVTDLAAHPKQNVVMAGGQRGIYRSRDNGTSYDFASSTEFQDKVTLPETWLFVSGEHEVDVVSEDETK